jgi:hypothetical protein
MAKKKVARGRSRGGVNKAQAIRDEFGVQGNDARPKDVIAALDAKGIKVASAQVSSIKAKLLGAGGKKRGRPAKGASNNGNVSLASLLAAKQLANKMGGVEAAKRALDVLVRLQ